jgi:hypothetical protein
MIIKRLGVAAVIIAATAQMAAANYQKGAAAYSKNDIQEAIQQWQSAATDGDAKAMVRLGKLYESGASDLSADLIEAYGWLKLAAAQGSVEAEQALAELTGKMSELEIEEGQVRATDALGIWYRKFTGQDEEAFQITKTEALRQKREQEQLEIDSQKEAARQRAETQKALIEKRKQDARNAVLKREQAREEAIRMAQLQAEEAKRKAALKDQQIAEEKRLAALRLEQRQQSSQTDAARQRLQELMAKQNGASLSQPSTVVRSAPIVVATSNGSTGDGLSAPAPKTTASQPVPQIKPKSVSVATKPTVASVPHTGSEIKQAVLAPVPSKKPGGEKIVLQEKTLTEKKIVLAETDTVKTDATTDMRLAQLDNLTGLDEETVIEIFEMADSVSLDTDAAQQEISDSLVRIDSLKWSLISGAKGDKSAPKMNKILMSKMSPIQIAEANRLARDWLIERQKRL